MDKDMEVKPLTGENEVLETVKVSEAEVKEILDSMKDFDIGKMSKEISRTLGITEQEAQKIAAKYTKDRKPQKIEAVEMDVGENSKDEIEDERGE